MNCYSERSVMRSIQNSIRNDQFCKYSSPRDLIAAANCRMEISFRRLRVFHLNLTVQYRNTLLTKALVWLSRTDKYFHLVLPIRLIVFRRGDVLQETFCRETRRAAVLVLAMQTAALVNLITVTNSAHIELRPAYVPHFLCFVRQSCYFPANMRGI